MPPSDTNICEPGRSRAAGRYSVAPRPGVDRKLVTEIRLFDVYEGAGLAEGKKSLAVTVVLKPRNLP